MMAKDTFDTPPPMLYGHYTCMTGLYSAVLYHLISFNSLNFRIYIKFVFVQAVAPWNIAFKSGPLCYTYTSWANFVECQHAKHKTLTADSCFSDVWNFHVLESNSIHYFTGNQCIRHVNELARLISLTYFVRELYNIILKLPR